MKTIRMKLFLFFMMCMAAFALLSILLNLIFLESYYIYKNKGIFIDAARNISDEYSRDPAGIQDFIKTTDRNEGISVIIASRDGNIKFSSFSASQGQGPLKLPSELEQVLQTSVNNLTAGYIYTIVDTPNSPVRQIAYAARLSSNDILILRKPVTWVLESTAIANEFLIYTGLLIIAVGGIVIYLLSKRITKPIVRMNETARSIARLDFDQRIEVRARDEIGELGQSINHIAEKLSVSLDDLKQDVERRKLLVRNLSHELKTPIGIIKGYTEGLQYGVAEDREKFEKYCGVITAECDRMDRMIREWLDLSKLESGIFQVKKEQVDIQGLIDIVVERFTHEIKQSGISISVTCEEAIKTSADRELMERQLSNLLANAIHHTEGEKRIHIQAMVVSGMCRISVFNTGKPIPSGELGRIWDVFYKSDKARSPRYSGHGLGLSIVKIIAELHEGTCGCENLPDGIRFFVEIPIK